MKTIQVTSVSNTASDKPFGYKSVMLDGEDSVITVDASKTFQSILGFGAAFTESACYVVSQMPQEERASSLRQLFGRDGARLNVGRLAVGASDYALEGFSYDEVAGDTDLRHFSTKRDERWVMPIVREALQENPALFLFASPWSPPGWMKTGGKLHGGWMREPFLEVYARYLLRYVTAYRAADIPIQALTVQNEVETDQLGAMPAAYWHPDFEATFVTDYLAPGLATLADPVALWVLDHNYAMWTRADWMLTNYPELAPSVDGVAFHAYQGDASMMSLLHERHPQLNIYWTEGGPDLGPDYLTDWCRWGEVFTAALRNWSRCLVAWNLALDEYGGPNIGPFSCAGLVTIQQQSHQISFSGQYRALQQFSVYVDRGAVRVASNEVAGVPNVAFKNPNGDLVVVLTNATRLGRDLIIRGGQRPETVRLEPSSITTVVLD